MKTFNVYASLLSLVIISVGCGKSGGGGNPTPAGNKAWLVKDIFTPTQCSGGGNNFEHLVFTYDDKEQIIRFIDSACAASSSYSYEMLYNAQGKITQINGFQGIYQISTFTVTYNSNGEFVAQVLPNDTAHYAITRYSWNLESNKELDEFVVQGNPLLIGLPYNHYYDFSYTAGGLHGEDFHSEGGPVQTLWTVYSEGTGKSISNPFHVGRTPEQNFLYSFFLGPKIDYLNVLGSSFPNGIFEDYSYTSGSKQTLARYYYNYVLDSNNNVSKIIPFGAQDAPNYGTFVQGAGWNITYEQH